MGLICVWGEDLANMVIGLEYEGMCLYTYSEGRTIEKMATSFEKMGADIYILR